MPAGMDSPDSIAPGSRGSFWLGLVQSHRIGRISRNGTISSVPGPADTFYTGIRAGPHGSLWITGEEYQNTLQQRIPTGALVSYTLPTTYSTPTDVAMGLQGYVWFTEQDTDQVGVLDVASGRIREYATPTALSAPDGIAIDTQGAIWFTERATNALGMIGADGHIAEFPLAAWVRASKWMPAAPHAASRHPRPYRSGIATWHIVQETPADIA